jgi:hypothetical protein
MQDGGIYSYTLMSSIERKLNRRSRAMHRRAYPIESTDCKSVKYRTIKIFLAGPFAIVLQRSTITSPVTGVTAFVPRHHHHKFYFNGDEQRTDRDYYVKLDITSLNIATYPDIDHGCDAFNCGTDWDGYKSHFIVLDLPCPERIIYSGQPIHAIFANRESGYVPLNHILEYSVERPNRGIKLKSSQLGDPCLPPETDTFRFEVGLPKETPKRKAHKHAVDFFNVELLSHFPRIKKQMRLARIRDTRGRTGSEHPFDSSAVECKNGGLIATTP